MTGKRSISIGTDKVDRTFYADLDQTYLSRISATFDPVNDIIWWLYPGQGNNGGEPNKIIVYSFSPSKTSKRWAIIQRTGNIIYRALSEGWTMEQLDTISPSLDALGISLDSRIWVGNTESIGMLDDEHYLSFF